jgi:hypothetical protein
MKHVPVAIIGAGPYGLSLAAHFAAWKIEHRIFGRPMLFWSNIAKAGGERYLKSYCFGTNISSPTPGYAFADYSRPRGLETFEPCPMSQFADYGKWFQENNVPWVEPVDVASVSRNSQRFVVTLTNGERFTASHVVAATGLACFATKPKMLDALPRQLCTHTADIESFAPFKGMKIAVIGAGQSALEAAALLHEAGAFPQLLIREPEVLWHQQITLNRSLWRRLRSPISGLGTGPKAWALTNMPGALHHAPEGWRTSFVKRHLPAEGAWWLRKRVEGLIPISLNSTVIDARETGSGISLRLDVRGESQRDLQVDCVVAGTGYHINVDRLGFLDKDLRGAIQRIEGSPRLNAGFESSVPGLTFAGPTSAMSFGPLFRFVIGTEYTARTIAARLGSRAAAAAA